jgi:hypothetical protein
MNLHLIIIDPSQSSKTAVVMPDDVPMSRLIPELAASLHLPSEHGGKPIIYMAEVKRIRKILTENDTLASGGVKNDDVLFLSPCLVPFVIEKEEYDSQNRTSAQVINVGGDISGSTIIIGNSNEVQHTTKINSQPNYAKIEKLMPALLKEMRVDLLNNPTTREFVILKRSWGYNSNKPYLAYYLEEHEDLEGKLQVLENLGLIREITYNNTHRYLFREELVDYLLGTEKLDS